MDEPKIRVEAPSALRGFFLALRLQGHDAQVVEEEEGRWTVEVPGDAPREWVFDCVQSWLDEEALQKVVVHIGDESHTMKTRGRDST